MLTHHAQSRFARRLAPLGVRSNTIARLAQVASMLSGSYAIKIATFETKRTLGRSTGDVAWAIVRNQNIMTVMLRESTRATSPEAFRVDKIAELENL